MSDADRGVLSWIDRPSFARDVLVQAIGSALGVGLIAIIGIFYGFITIPENLNLFVSLAESALFLLSGFGLLWLLRRTVGSDEFIEKHGVKWLNVVKVIIVAAFFVWIVWL